MSRHEAAGVVWAVVAGVAAGLALWVFGVSVPFAAGAGMLMLAGGVAWAGFAGGRSPVYLRDRPRPRPGTRSDVMRLAWSLHDRDGRVSDAGSKRLHGFARGRLALAGLDLDDPGDADRIRTLLGSDACATLTGGGRPTLAAVERCVDRLDGAAASDPVGGRRGRSTS